MKKKILCILNYYYPYISGLSEYARIVCEKLVQRGYDVTVLTTNHQKLEKTEMINGVKIIRAKIIGKISKGTVSIEFIKLAQKLSKQMDLVYLQLPMIESGIITKLIEKDKIMTMYHCDLNLPNHFLNRIILNIMDLSNHICLKNSKIITVTSIDYASKSRVAHKYISKLVEVGAPIKGYNRIEQTKEKGKNVIGFCGRIVEEKGIDILIKAFEILSKKREDLFLKIAGDYQNVAGGSIYPRLKSYIEEKHISHIQFLGKIPESEMEAFYSSLDIFVLPSINSLEAFGMVQVEAMYCGVPVVASDLYGVRTIVKKTKMGEVFKKGDAKDLANCMEKVLNSKEQYIKSKSEIEKIFGTNKCVDEIENSIKKII